MKYLKESYQANPMFIFIINSPKPAKRPEKRTEIIPKPPTLINWVVSGTSACFRLFHILVKLQLELGQGYLARPKAEENFAQFYIYSEL